ncbi:AT-rich interactive domain-containing 3A-like protein [Sarcoptes scabiei]|uniref:AT-rich interactive domain-containing 3A-like protein n=1 Tax=Sarcoptes scabiei TaxID=52283 RepID=A0A132A8H8_SARSC|nr:AT-rich interactive domain-containing 3A-like protein [Sarcoptes scabiei]
MDDPTRTKSGIPNGGSKPTTPIPPSSPIPQPLSVPNSMIQSSPSQAPTLATSHGTSRYGYQPIPPSVGMHHGGSDPSMHPGQSPNPYQHQPNNHLIGGHPHHNGGYPLPPQHGPYVNNGPQHPMLPGGHPQPQPSPTSGHHHPHHQGQYMPMMMPPPSQYPNKSPAQISHFQQPGIGSGNPGGPQTQNPQQQPQPNVPIVGQDGRSYGPYPPPPPRMSGNAPYYSIRHPQPQAQQPPHHPQMNKSYGYPNQSGIYPGPLVSNPAHGPNPSVHQPIPPPHQYGGQLPLPPQAGPNNGPIMSHGPPHGHPQPMPPHYGPYGNAEMHINQSNSNLSGSGNQIPLVPNSSTNPAVPSNSNVPNSNGTHRLPQPPSIIDEVSQTSTTSSQTADDNCAPSDVVSHKHPKHHLSHPSTPNASNLESPGAASLSSFHDEFDSVSSPSWPRTPASPAVTGAQYDSHVHSTKRPDNVQKLYEMSDEPERKLFLDKYFQFLDERATPLNQVPTISKVPVDLYRLYMLVKERGGYLEVTRSKLWKDCAQFCNIANSSSASYTLRKQYMKHLLPFECKFDRGGIDVGPLLSAVDTANVNRKKSNNSKLPNSGPSTPLSSRLSSNDSPAPTYHHHPPANVHQNFEVPTDSPQPSSYANAPGSGNNGPNPNVQGYPHQPPFHSQHQEYHHPQQYGNVNAGAPSVPPLPPNQIPNSGPPPSINNPTASHANVNHESVSVKDPFADEETVSSPRVHKTPNTPNYPPRSQHFPLSNNSGPYYGQGAPSQPQISQPSSVPPQPLPPSHPSAYPEGQNPYQEIPGSYQRPNSSAPDGQSSSNIYPRAGMNGPMHHGYYGIYPPNSQSQQTPPPPPLPSHPPQSQPPVGYDPHTGSSASGPGRPQTPQARNIPYEHQPNYPMNQPVPPAGHRYPIPNNMTHSVGLPPSIPGNYGSSSRSPYPGPMTHSHHPQPAAQPSASSHPQPPPATSQQNQQSQQQPGHYSSTVVPPPSSAVRMQQDAPSGKNSDNYNSVIRMPSPLAQRLLAAKLSQNSSNTAQNSTQPPSQPPTSASASVSSSQQVFPNAPSSYGPSLNASGTSTMPPTKVLPPAPIPSSTQNQASTNISWISSPSQRYPQPKRHPDFAKQQASTPTPSDSYPPASSYPPNQQHLGAIQRGPAPPSNSSPMWNRENYRMPGPNYYHSFSNNNGVGGSNNSHPGHMPPRDHNWHESRPMPSSNSTSNSAAGNAMETPLTTAHWSSNRFGVGYSDFNNAQSSHYNSSGSLHLTESSKAPPSSQYSNLRQDSNRPNFVSGSSHSQIYSKVSGHSYSPYIQLGPNHGGSVRRESIFPPNSVEATVPTPVKRRKLLARDIAPVEAWRLYMSLKSGLLVESTFALDVLNIYSNDDNTLIYLSLANMPGLLEVLLEHYRRYLNEMFSGLFDDIGIGQAKTDESDEKRDGLGNKSKRQLEWYEIEKDIEDDEADANRVDDIEKFLDKKFQLNGKKKLTLFDSTNNYTNITRNGKPVKIKKDDNLFILDHDKKWDLSKQGFQKGLEHWKNGGGETVAHIQSHMEPKERYIRFCRLIKCDSKKSSDSTESDEDNETENSIDASIEENDHEVNRKISLNGDAIEKSIKNNVLDDNNDSNDVETDENHPTDKNDMESFLNNENNYPKIHPTDRERYWKRLHQPDLEEESYDQEEPAVCTGRTYQDSIRSRCLTVSNLIRNLTFVPGNDQEMCKNSCLLLILSRLIVLHHVHAVKKKHKISDIDCTKFSSNKFDEKAMLNLINNEKSSSLESTDQQSTLENEWWREALHLIRENTLVTLANISGQLDMSIFPEQITLSLLDGLLHWAVCPSSYAQDSFPSAPTTLSPRRLAYETLAKLSIYESNVDLILATPSWSRIERFLKNLTKSLVKNEDQTIREFSIVLISNFATADSSVVKVIALCGYIVPLLLGFIEQAEQSALSIANAHGIQYLRDNFDIIGTTPDMIRRAASILRTLARYSENHSLFIQHEQRLLSLSMSQILDNTISSIIADILFECSFDSPTSSSLSSSSSNLMNISKFNHSISITNTDLTNDW